MECEPALRRIEETIGPFIGRHMAKASIQVQCQKLGIKDGRITTQQLRAILEGIGLNSAAGIVGRVILTPSKRDGAPPR